jgi:hypothetical protein
MPPLLAVRTLPNAKALSRDTPQPLSVVQKNAQQRAMDLDLAVIFDESKLPEFVHEVAHPRTRRPNHLRKRLLADLSRDRLRPAFLAEIRQQKKNPGQALFAGVEQLIDQVFFHPDVARQ